MCIYIIFGQAQHPGGTICHGFQIINTFPNTISTQSDINYGNLRPSCYICYRMITYHFKVNM